MPSSAADDAPHVGASQHLLIAGAPALSDFRRERYLRALVALDDRVADVTAHYLYFLALDAAPDTDARRRLDAILNDGIEWPLAEATGIVDVVPRIGTISPWSTKATDIAARCGLDGVARVERGVRFVIDGGGDASVTLLARVAPALYDRMTESCFIGGASCADLFVGHEAAPLEYVRLGTDPVAALHRANSTLGLALSDGEIDYLVSQYDALGRDPTDAELMMFAQANSEHCRHKIFNADWIIDGEPCGDTLFGMIRNTTQRAPDGVLSAYEDNAAVIAGPTAERLLSGDPAHGSRYTFHEEPVDILIKVETHNHPTAISPFPGAATGAGGEIRDEGATGLGAAPKAGLTGFSVSNLHIPGFRQPWEQPYGKPGRIVTPLEIMLEGPIGSAAFNNEFGRPNLGGYFRTFEIPHPDDAGTRYGYHKPIMIAGGLGNVRREHARKREVAPGAALVVLGGPAMLIGLGGGAASSMGSGSSDEALDFASVQRGNPEMQRRAQEVINHCWSLGPDNPIALIHDVGAGGLSNAVPEAVDHSGLGGRFELRDIPTDEPGMSPLEIWCNESQERYVLLIDPARLPEFESICRRERCPFAVLGQLTDEDRLLVEDRLLGDTPVDLPMPVLLGNTPKLTRDVRRVARPRAALDLAGIDLGEACQRVLMHPAVADKSFLIHIGDRTVGGLTARDQLVGPWQVPVSDVAVTTSGYRAVTGEAMAMGERTPVAAVDAAAATRLAIAEAITNIAAADIERLGDVRLSANWMAAAGEPGEDAALFDAVRTAGIELCPALGIAVPVGKDSLSMATRWMAEDGSRRQVVAPVSLIVSAFSPVADVRRTLTPQLRALPGSRLLAIDLGGGARSLGQSCLAQVFGLAGGEPADLASAEALTGFFAAIGELRRAGRIAAYHDRSDGGLFACVAEMMFAARIGVELHLDAGAEPLAQLFSEAPGAVIQVAAEDLAVAAETFERHGLGGAVSEIGGLADAPELRIMHGDTVVLGASRAALQRYWSETSYRLQALRDNPATAAEAFEALADEADPGLNVRLTFDPAEDIAAPYIASGVRPRVAVLREQGVNSHNEMAAAFTRAGFDAYDVHMSDLMTDRFRLDQFDGVVACGGFSYGDVLGAGGGWAKSILFDAALREQFERFFAAPGTFSLGICNGCQMMAQLSELIPGAVHWPVFLRNRSEQFEARLSLVEIAPSPSLFLAGMAGTRIPVATSHGEGRAAFAERGDLDACERDGLVAVRYVDNYGQPATRYPANPNGSPGGLCGLTSADGRATIMMPHPERVHRTVQHSWHPPEWGEDAPWLRMFRNARRALG